MYLLGNLLLIIVIFCITISQRYLILRLFSVVVLVLFHSYCYTGDIFYTLRLLLVFSSLWPAVNCYLLLICRYLFPIPSVLLHIYLLLLAYFLKKKNFMMHLLCLFFQILKRKKHF